jgi:hypothetical protein
VAKFALLIRNLRDLQLGSPPETLGREICNLAWPAGTSRVHTLCHARESGHPVAINVSVEGTGCRISRSSRAMTGNRKELIPALPSAAILT